jgi:hypothetical protein
MLALPAHTYKRDTTAADGKLPFVLWKAASLQAATHTVQLQQMVALWRMQD